MCGAGCAVVLVQRPHDQQGACLQALLVMMEQSCLRRGGYGTIFGVGRLAVVWYVMVGVLGLGSASVQRVGQTLFFQECSGALPEQEAQLLMLTWH